MTINNEILTVILEAISDINTIQNTPPEAGHMPQKVFHMINHVQDDLDEFECKLIPELKTSSFSIYSNRFNMSVYQSQPLFRSEDKEIDHLEDELIKAMRHITGDNDWGFPQWEDLMDV